MRKEQEALKDGEIVSMGRRVSVRQPDGSIDYKVGGSGPATVISNFQNGSTAVAYMRGVLFKCARTGQSRD
eukprot:3706442-Pyramimonas_sp.AAC.1